MWLRESCSHLLTIKLVHLITDGAHRRQASGEDERCEGQTFLGKIVVVCNIFEKEPRPFQNTEDDYEGCLKLNPGFKKTIYGMCVHH
jgi:hypothetical protein